VRAVTIRAHGGVEALRAESLPDPVPGPGQVRVRVKAVALNHLDLWVRQGLPGLRVEMPHVLGSDVAGIVDEVGPGGDATLVGQRVLINPGLSCGRCPACLSGDDNLCSRYRILGEHVGGGYCELLVVPAQNLVPCPERLPIQLIQPSTGIMTWLIDVGAAGM